MRRRTPAPLAYVLHKPRHRVSVLARVLPVPEPSQKEPRWPFWPTPASRRRAPPPQLAAGRLRRRAPPPLLAAGRLRRRQPAPKNLNRQI